MNATASKLVAIQVLHRRDEAEVHVLLPHLERRHEEVVDARDERREQQQSRLRSALLAGHQHFSDRGRLRVRKLAVHLAHEVAAKGNQEQHAQAAAGQADEDGLHRVRVELEDVEGGEREDGARHHRTGRATDRGDDDVLEQRGTAAVHARQPDGEDRDRDRGFHHLADLQS
jgi:hypothetical protein